MWYDFGVESAMLFVVHVAMNWGGDKQEMF